MSDEDNLNIDERFVKATQSYRDIFYQIGAYEGVNFASKKIPAKLRASKLKKYLKSDLAVQTAISYSKDVDASYGDMLIVYINYKESSLPQLKATFNEALHKLENAIKTCRDALDMQEFGQGLDL